jgi:hypothetical protein
LAAEQQEDKKQAAALVGAASLRPALTACRRAIRHEQKRN